MKLKFLILFIILNTTCITYCQSSDCFVTKKFKAVIFPDSYKSVWLYLDSFKRFTPNRLEVTQTEETLQHQIRRIVKSNNRKISSFEIKDRKRVYRYFKHYKRQYFGYLNSKGERILLIHAYLGRKRLGPNDCDTEYFLIFDGGASVWDIEFNLETRTFSGFGTNGYA